MKTDKRGFTVIELLTVLAIIGILAGLIMGAAQSARQQAMKAKAKASICTLETALGMFQSDIGGYPSTGNDNLIAALANGAGTYVIGSQTLSLPTSNWNGPYMNFQTNEIKDDVFIDPWGHPYAYINPGTNHGAGANYSLSYVDIWSFGPNGIDENGAGDDIANWKR